MLRRSIVSVLVPLLGATTLPAQHESKIAPPKIVFVCEHGAAKSVIAARELEKLARERGISIQAVSRGKTPDPDIPDSGEQRASTSGDEPPAPNFKEE